MSVITFRFLKEWSIVVSYEGSKDQVKIENAGVLKDCTRQCVVAQVFGVAWRGAALRGVACSDARSPAVAAAALPLAPHLPNNNIPNPARL